MFRAAVARGSELGNQVNEIIDAGNLVPDELTSAVVRDRLSQADAADGFLLDGYPRNLGQVGDLDAFLAGRGEALDAVIELVVPRDESIERLTRRAQEQGRTDDTEEVIANRLAIYERETAPILDVYRERGIVDRDRRRRLARRDHRPRHRRARGARPGPLGRRLSVSPLSCAARSTSRPPSCGRWSSPA